MEKELTIPCMSIPYIGGDLTSINHWERLLVTSWYRQHTVIIIIIIGMECWPISRVQCSRIIATLNMSTSWTISCHCGWMQVCIYIYIYIYIIYIIIYIAACWLYFVLQERDESSWSIYMLCVYSLLSNIPNINRRVTQIYSHSLWSPTSIPRIYTLSLSEIGK